MWTCHGQPGGFFYAISQKYLLHVAVPCTQVVILLLPLWSMWLLMLMSVPLTSLKKMVIEGYISLVAVDTTYHCSGISDKRWPVGYCLLLVQLAESCGIYWDRVVYNWDILHQWMYWSDSPIISYQCDNRWSGYRSIICYHWQPDHLRSLIIYHYHMYCINVFIEAIARWSPRLSAIAVNRLSGYRFNKVGQRAPPLNLWVKITHALTHYLASGELP